MDYKINYNGSLKIIPEIGNIKNNNSLKAYKYENILKKAFKENKLEIITFFTLEYKIPETLKLKVKNSENKKVIEEYSLIELLSNKLNDLKSDEIINLYEMYINLGIISVVKFIHLNYHIQNI